jgi:hypothetical protein
VLLEAAQVQRSGGLDELEEPLLEQLFLASALPTPRPERERVSRDGVDSLTFRTASSGDMLSVGQEPHLVELKELRRTISTGGQEHRRAFRLDGSEGLDDGRGRSGTGAF